VRRSHVFGTRRFYLATPTNKPDLKVCESLAKRQTMPEIYAFPRYDRQAHLVPFAPTLPCASAVSITFVGASHVGFFWNHSHNRNTESLQCRCKRINFVPTTQTKSLTPMCQTSTRLRLLVIRSDSSASPGTCCDHSDSPRTLSVIPQRAPRCSALHAKGYWESFHSVSKSPDHTCLRQLLHRFGTRACTSWLCKKSNRQVSSLAGLVSERRRCEQV